MNKKLDGATFVLKAAAMAEICAQWAKGSMIAPQYLFEPVYDDKCWQFLSEIRGRCDEIERYLTCDPSAPVNNLMQPTREASDQRPASSGKALTGKAQGAWLPISTAPRNDTLVTLGFWAGIDDPRWIAVSGWYEAGPADQCWYSAYDEERIEPTHWQPLDRLPAPPASSGQGGR